MYCLENFFSVIMLSMCPIFIFAEEEGYGNKSLGTKCIAI